jgi:hypothetical protein
LLPTGESPLQSGTARDVALAAMASSKLSEVNDDMIAATAGPALQLALRLV